MTTRTISHGARSLTLKKATEKPSDLAAASNVKLRCGDCMHFKGTAHPSYGAVCSALGTRASALAPACYTANVSVFRPLGPDFVRGLAVTVASMDAQQQRVLMGLLRNAAALDKVGLTFMQKVYFSMGGDCLENWYTGFVLAPGPDRGTVLLVGQDYAKGNRTLCTALLLVSSLVTSHKKFTRIKDDLVARGQIKRLPPKLQPKVAKEDYEPPTMETNPEALEALANKLGKRKKTPLKKDANGNSILFSISQSDLD